MKYKSIRYASADGRLDLFARDYGGAGTPLLLMHGLTRNSADFEPLARHLASGYRLIVPDQRGRGMSPDDSDPANYRLDVYAADMFALLKTIGLESCGVIGTSMGGLIALAMNAQKPGYFPAMVLNDIGPVLSPDGLDRIAGYVGGGGAMIGWDEAARHCAAVNGAAFPDLDDADWLAWAQRTCREAANGTVRLAYDPAIAQAFTRPDDVTEAQSWRMWEALGSTPVLVLRGALSDLLSMDTVREMERRHDGPFEHVEVPGRGHAPLLDEPVAVSAIAQFLRENLD